MLRYHQESYIDKVYQKLAETKKQLTEYINAGHIRPSTSPFGAPILLVKKERWNDENVY